MFFGVFLVGFVFCSCCCSCVILVFPPRPGPFSWLAWDILNLRQISFLISSRTQNCFRSQQQVRLVVCSLSCGYVNSRIKILQWITLVLLAHSRCGNFGNFIPKISPNSFWFGLCPKLPGELRESRAPGTIQS